MAATDFFRILLLLIIIESTAVAKTRVELLNNLFFQSGNGGKQVYDGTGNQSMTVYEPVLYIDSVVSPETTLNLKALIDTWSGASDKAFDTSTGASAQSASSSGKGHSGGSSWKSRNDIDLAATQKVGGLALKPSFGYSTSLPYESIHGGLGLEHGFAEDCFTLGLSYHHYQDKTKGFDFTNKVLTNWNPRLTDSVDLGASQILTTSDIIFFGVGYTKQHGLLSTNTNTVSLNGARVGEILPSDRSKKIVSGRFVHGISEDLAAHLDYRYYTDNWDIRAHSIEPSLVLSNEEETQLLRLFYRFHTQTATSYYADQFTTAQPQMTSDSDLAAFRAHEVGAQGSLRYDVKNLDFLEVGGGLVYYTRSNNLSFVVVQFSLAVGF